MAKMLERKYLDTTFSEQYIDQRVDSTFIDCLFKVASVCDVQFERTTFVNCKIKGTEYSETLFDSVDLRKCEVCTSQFKACSFEDSVIKDTTFTNCYFDNVVFKNTKFENCKFENCVFAHSRFECCEFMSHSIFASCIFKSSFVERPVGFGSVLVQGVLVKQSVSALVAYMCNDSRELLSRVLTEDAGPQIEN